MKIYKKFILILFLFILIALPSDAEKIPVKITPIQIISTNHDEIEVGDWIKFVTVNDIFLNDKVYIKKDTDIVGIVDFVHQNGWGGDSAEICFKTFYTQDVNNKKIVISYPLDINGNLEMATNTRDVASQGLTSLKYIHSLTNIPFIRDAAFILRGAEIFVEPDTRIFNIFLTQ